ncbi:MAG: caspase family protein [Candidatus Kapabacteria bacterium]|nr:caspase family protein [Candidatus Kapabacteria bacterium]
MNCFFYTVLLILTTNINILFAENDAKISINLPDENGNNSALYSKSYALIIGVSNYYGGWPKLPGVTKDIEAVKSSLEKQHFTCVVVVDPDNVKLSNAFNDFISKYGYDTENRLLFYFAGHGHTIKSSYGEEMGYIIPANTPNPNKNKEGFMSTAMNMQEIEVFAKKIQSKHALFLFDACFSGSIFSLSRAIPENISYKTRKPVRQFITSGSAEESVPDESVFRKQFISGLDGEADVNKDGFITGSEIGEFLQERVVNYSNGTQHPQYGKIRNPNLDKGDFVFVVNNQENLLISNSSKLPAPVQTRSENSASAPTTIPNNNDANFPKQISTERPVLPEKKSIMKAQNELENWYVFLSVAFPKNFYPTVLTTYIQDNISATSLPIAGSCAFYFPLNNSSLIGGSIGATNDAYYVIGHNDLDSSNYNKGMGFSFYDFSISGIYYFFKDIGDSWYARLDLGFTGLMANHKTLCFDTTPPIYESYNLKHYGYTTLAGFGYSLPISSGTRFDFFCHAIFRSISGVKTSSWTESNFIESGTYSTVQFGVGILF